MLMVPFEVSSHKYRACAAPAAGLQALLTARRSLRVRRRIQVSFVWPMVLPGTPFQSSSECQPTRKAKWSDFLSALLGLDCLYYVQPRTRDLNPRIMISEFQRHGHGS